LEKHVHDDRLQFQTSLKRGKKKVGRELFYKFSRKKEREKARKIPRNTLE